MSGTDIVYAATSAAGTDMTRLRSADTAGADVLVSYAVSGTERRYHAKTVLCGVRYRGSACARPCAVSHTDRAYPAMPILRDVRY
eukprot:37913-Rhodomonas_salina.4